VAWMSVCCQCCVLSGRGLCDELNTRPEESYRLWCVVVCDLETSWKRRPWPLGAVSPRNKNKLYILLWRNRRWKTVESKNRYLFVLFNAVLPHVSCISLCMRFHISIPHLIWRKQDGKRNCELILAMDGLLTLRYLRAYLTYRA